MMDDDLLPGLVEEMKANIEDEDKASTRYGELSAMINSGASPLPNFGQAFVQMASDENDHYATQKDMVDIIEGVCERRGGGFMTKRIPRDCEMQGVMLIEAVESIHFALGKMQPGEATHQAMAALTLAEEHLNNSNRGEGPTVNLTDVYDEIKKAKIAGRTEDISLMSESSIRASEKLERIIPQAVADCACRELKEEV